MMTQKQTPARLRSTLMPLFAQLQRLAKSIKEVLRAFFPPSQEDAFLEMTSKALIVAVLGSILATLGRSEPVPRDDRE